MQPIFDINILILGTYILGTQIDKNAQSTKKNLKLVLSSGAIILSQTSYYKPPQRMASGATALDLLFGVFTTAHKASVSKGKNRFVQLLSAKLFFLD